MEETNPATRKSPVRRTSKQIVKLLKDFAGREGMTIVEFCKFNDIHKSNFYNWQKRYAIKQLKPGKSKGFVSLELPPTLIHPAVNVPLLFAEVKGIRLYQAVSSEYLKALLS
ncbi:MAG: hypothetical protein ABIN89_02530 [Chitinophagaceae bacterium]